jgi:hypothetical protein
VNLITLPARVYNKGAATFRRSQENRCCRPIKAICAHLKQHTTNPPVSVIELKQSSGSRHFIKLSDSIYFLTIKLCKSPNLHNFVFLSLDAFIYIYIYAC